MRQQTVVLVGAGHAHLYVAARAAEFRRAGARLVLIDPGSFWYSGLATGMLGAMFDAADDRLDPQALIENQGGEFIADRVVSVDCERRQLQLASGGVINYDYLSLNVGSVVNKNTIAGADDDPSVWTVKPVSNLWHLRRQLERSFAAGRAPSVAVVGGGPSGCEVAANLLALAARHGASLPVTLLSRSERLIATAPASPARWLAKTLREKGLRICFGEGAKERRGSTLVSESGKAVDAELVVIATGLEAPPLMSELGLPFDASDGLCVNQHLQSPADPRVFAVGDCASLQGHHLPKLGVFGVRQAPILHGNLLATLQSQALQAYRPQRRYLSILNLGDGRGLALWGPLWWQGWTSLRLKNHLDFGFLRGYRQLEH